MPNFFGGTVTGLQKHNYLIFCWLSILREEKLVKIVTVRDCKSFFLCINSRFHSS